MCLVLGFGGVFTVTVVCALLLKASKRYLFSSLKRPYLLGCKANYYRA